MIVLIWDYNCIVDYDTLRNVAATVFRENNGCHAVRGLKTVSTDDLYLLKLSMELK